MRLERSLGRPPQHRIAIVKIRSVTTTQGIRIELHEYKTQTRQNQRAAYESREALHSNGRQQRCKEGKDTAFPNTECRD